MAPDLDVPAGTIFLSPVYLDAYALLTTVAQALTGRGPASRFTHSWISLGHGYAAGMALDSGAYVDRLEPEDVTPEVLQLPPPGGPLSPAMRRLLWDEAHRLAGTPYDRLAAALSILPAGAFRARRARTAAPFCSAFVAHLLAHVSHPASSRPPHAMTPADLRNSQGASLRALV